MRDDAGLLWEAVVSETRDALILMREVNDKTIMKKIIRGRRRPKSDRQRRGFSN